MGSPRSILINGRWRIRADAGNVGLAEGWFRSPNEFLNIALTNAIEVPGAWQHVLGESYHYLAWYRTRTIIPEDWPHTRTRLRFHSVATSATVWVNGERVGANIGDWIPFDCEISEIAEPGRSIDIVARVDEQLGHITKGFHDMLSIHHGGIWGDVELIGSGACCARPNGVWVDPSRATGAIQIAVELDEHSDPTDCGVRVSIVDWSDRIVMTSDSTNYALGSRSFRTSLSIDSEDVRPWSPEDPVLYRADVELFDGEGKSERHSIPFGFRDVRVEGTRILFNDSPIHLRSVLHWGHEPRHLAPRPTPQQARDEFANLLALGFNCVCLCMWYPPSYYFEIADEMGMLIWQEHPNWHAPMDVELLSEYRRLYTEFMRRDRNHPSVILISAACEHPCFQPELADWWWSTSHKMLPNHLLQVQTSSFAWSNPKQTDLYDEHTYENNNRWVTYLQDLQDVLAALTPKPFVMGESVIFTSWPDVKTIQSSASQSVCWSLPKCHESALGFEQRVRERFGPETFERFKRNADRHHLLGRKFQIELFRRYPNHAGLVMNHLRDVPACTCGFMNALGDWRFSPKDFRSWMNDAPTLLKTPDDRRSFVSNEEIECEVFIPNFSHRFINTQLSITCDDQIVRIDESIICDPGMLGQASFVLPIQTTERPICSSLNIAAAEDSLEPNDWNLWTFPHPITDVPQTYRLEGLPFADDEQHPDSIERGYSRGFGLPVKRWVNRLPNPGTLLPHVLLWRVSESIPNDARVIVTHRLTKGLIDFLERGGRVLLLASKASGGLRTSYEWLFGQCPLIIEEGPLQRGDSDWIVDLLSFDLTRTYCRVIPIQTLGWSDRVLPLIRLVYTHDQDEVKFFDMLFATRIDAGVLAVSSLDHHDPAGRYLLDRIISWLKTDQCTSFDDRISADDLRPFAHDSQALA